MIKDLVTIIIPTYNEAAHIGECLASLQKQTYVGFDIIVVDDGSTDNTVAIASEFEDVTVIKQDHQGPGAARNLGASQARGEVLVFVDADMTFAVDFIEDLVRPIFHQKVIGTFSKNELVANMDNPWASAWSYLRGFENGRMHPKEHPDQQPVFRAIRKSAFDSVGGFETNRGYDDDWSISEKSGELAQVAKGAEFYHTNPSSLADIFMQARWLAKRSYKFGILGQLIALLRASWPFSLVRGVLAVVIRLNPFLLPARLSYDLGISVGLLEHLFKLRTAK